MTAVVDQLALEFPTRGTLVARYRRWRDQHPEVVAEITSRVLARANRGDRRIEINDVFADVRGDLKVKLDNSMRAPLARDLIAAHPFLAEKIETRRRRAT